MLTMPQSVSFKFLIGFVVLAILCLTGNVVAPLHAQLSVPEVTMSGRGMTERIVSASEAAYYVTVERVKLDARLSFRQAHYPKDSMRAVVAVRAKEWLTRLQQHPVRGIQLD